MISHSSILRTLAVWTNEAVEVSGSIDIDQSLDLIAAALEDDDPVLEKSRLVSRGFVHGRVVRWVSDGGEMVVSLTVHELASEAEALLSLADLREQLRAAAVDLRIATETQVRGHMAGSAEEPSLTYHSTVHGALQVTVVLALPVGAGVDSSVIAESVIRRQLALLL